MTKTRIAIAAVLLALLGAFAAVVPAQAARMFNFDTNAWEDQTTFQAHASSRSYSAIPREVISYDSKFKAGTIIVETGERRLYFVLPNGQAIRYGIGVGRDGFRWSGQHTITRTAEWPGWTPPAEMRRRVPDLPAFMPGGPDNPLGAPRPVHRRHALPHPWYVGAVDHRPGGELGLHPPHQRRHHRPLQPREGWIDGGGSAVADAPQANSLTGWHIAGPFSFLTGR